MSLVRASVQLTLGMGAVKLAAIFTDLSATAPVGLPPVPVQVTVEPLTVSTIPLVTKVWSEGRYLQLSRSAVTPSRLYVPLERVNFSSSSPQAARNAVAAITARLIFFMEGPFEKKLVSGSVRDLRQPAAG